MSTSTADMAATEASPLLSDVPMNPELSKRELLYRRFSPQQKRGIVAVIAWAGLIPFLVSGSFVPCVPEIARELGTTGSVINLAVSVSLVSTAVGSLIWATYSGKYGRRFVYLRSLPCLCIGSIGVTSSHSVPELLSWRVVQALGSSSAMSVGAAVVGDRYKLEERGTAMGIFLGASLVGPAIAPLCGGIATQYASWRYAQWALFLMGLSAFISVALWLPETIDPEVLQRHKDSAKRFAWLRINPFRSLAVLRSPNIMILTLAGTTGLVTDFVLLIPLSYTIGKQYNITNPALIGAFFIPAGIGNIRRKRRGGVWLPEDRIRACLWGAGVLCPMSVLLTGLTIKYVPGAPGIVLNLIWLFMNGIGVDIVLTPSSSYYVDILHSKSAETMAASALPFDLAADALVNLRMFALTIRYGERMRAWVDIGYSTMRDN
ncbi:MFS general substrate transporter [Fomes fomentarius]|nr:MFS general substrate transporter [Fomes fomentarius]